MPSYLGMADRKLRVRMILLGGAGIAAITAFQPASSQSIAPQIPVATSTDQTRSSPATVDDGSVAEIVVTAQKRAQNAQNVPISITALGATQLASAGISDVADLKAAVPALNVTTAVGGFGLPRIRGIGATGQGPGVENPVAVYVDGVYYGAAFGVLQSLFDVQQVAVLKGPQGTLFGRNATGGLIQITTLDPSYQFKAKGQIGYGNYDTLSGAGYVSGGLTGNLAIGLSGQYEVRNNGFGKNIATGNDIQDGRSYNGRAKLLWEPGPGTSVLLAADINRRDASEPAFRQFSRNTLGQVTPGSDRDINADVDPDLTARQWGTSATVSHDFGGVKLKSITAYRDSKLRTVFDPDGTTQPFIIIDNRYYDKQFTQEMNFVSDTSGPLQWVIGGFYMHDSSGDDPGRITGIYTFGNNGYSVDLFNIRLNSYAAYADATYALDDATHIIGGLRYTSDKRSLNYHNTSYNGNIGVTTTSTPLIEARTFDKLTWRLSVDHRFSPELLAYASYNRGFRSGAFVPGGQISLTLEPEVVDAYEVGLKSDLFDRKVRLNLAGYYYNQDKVQVQQIIAGRNSVYNADGAHIYGFDGDVTWRVTSAFSLFGGASYVRAHYTKFTTAVVSTPFPLPAGFAIPAGQSCLGTFGNPFTQVGGNCLLIGDASGSRLQATPKFTGSLGGSYEIATEFGKFTLAGNYYYNDGFYGSVDGRVRQPHYNMADASITWHNATDHLSVQAWGKNLTNALYRTQLSATNSGDNGTIGAPRTYGITVGFQF